MINLPKQNNTGVTPEPTTPTKKPFLGDFGRSLGMGAVGLGRSFVGLGQLIDDFETNNSNTLKNVVQSGKLGQGVQNLYSTGSQNRNTAYTTAQTGLSNKYQTMASKSYTSTKSFGEAFKTADARYFALKGAEMLPQLAGTVAASLATGGIGGVAFTTGSATGGEYADRRDLGFSDNKAILSSIGSGALQGALDYLPVGRALSRIPGGNKVLAKLTNELATDKGLRQLATSMAKSTAGGAFSEGFTEGTQQLVSNAFMRAYDKDRELFDGVFENAVLGSMLGGSMDFTISSLGVTADKIKNRQSAAQEIQKYETVKQIVETKIAAKEQAIQDGTYQIGDTQYDITPEEQALMANEQKFKQAYDTLHGKTLTGYELNDAFVKVNVIPYTDPTSGKDVYKAQLMTYDADNNLVNTIDTDTNFNTVDEAVEALGTIAPKELVNTPDFKLLTEQDTGDLSGVDKVSNVKKDIINTFPKSPISNERIFYVNEEPVAGLEINVRDGEILLDNIRTLDAGKGYASAALEQLKSIANKYGYRIVGEIKPTGEKLLNKKELSNFYKKNEFSVNGTKIEYNTNQTPDFKIPGKDVVVTREQAQAVERINELKRNNGVSFMTYAVDKLYTSKSRTQRAMGMYYKGAITLSDMVTIVTADHEFSHFILDNWDNVPSTKELGFTKDELFQEVRDMYGNNMTDKQVNEKISELVEEMRYSKMKNPDSLISKFIKYVYNTITEMLGLNKDGVKLLDKYYNQIFEGKVNTSKITVTPSTMSDMEKAIFSDDAMYQEFQNEWDEYIDKMQIEENTELAKQVKQEKMEVFVKAKSKKTFTKDYVKKQSNRLDKLENDIQNSDIGSEMIKEKMSEIKYIKEKIKAVNTKIDTIKTDKDMYSVISEMQPLVERMLELSGEKPNVAKKMSLVAQLKAIYEITPTMYNDARKSLGITGSISKVEPEKIAELMEELKSRFDYLQKRKYAQSNFSRMDAKDRRVLLSEKPKDEKRLTERVAEFASKNLLTISDRIRINLGQRVTEWFKMVDNNVERGNTQARTDSSDLIHINEKIMKDRKLTESEKAILTEKGILEMQTTRDLNKYLNTLMQNHSYMFDTWKGLDGAYEKSSWHPDFLADIKTIENIVGSNEITPRIESYYKKANEYWTKQKEYRPELGYVPFFVARMLKETASSEKVINHMQMKFSEMYGKDPKGSVEMQKKIASFITTGDISDLMVGVGETRLNQERVLRDISSDLASEFQPYYSASVSYFSLVNKNEVLRKAFKGIEVKDGVLEMPEGSFLEGLDIAGIDIFSNTKQAAVLKNIITEYLRPPERNNLVSTASASVYALTLGQIMSSVTQVFEFIPTAMRLGTLNVTQSFNPNFIPNVLEKLKIDPDTYKKAEQVSMGDVVDKVLKLVSESDKAALSASIRNVLAETIKVANKNITKGIIYRRIQDMFPNDTARVMELIRDFSKDINQEIPPELAHIAMSIIRDWRKVSQLEGLAIAKKPLGQVFLTLKHFSIRVTSALYAQYVIPVRQAIVQKDYKTAMSLSFELARIVGGFATAKILTELIRKYLLGRDDEDEEVVKGAISDTILAMASAGFLNSFSISQAASGNAKKATESLLNNTFATLATFGITLGIDVKDVIKGVFTGDFKDLSEFSTLQRIPIFGAFIKEEGGFIKKL